LKIAIIAPTFLGGGRARAEAYKSFLQSKNHYVDTVSFDEAYTPEVWYFCQRARAHLLDKEPESRLMEK
jgi:hypothetical protein